MNTSVPRRTPGWFYNPNFIALSTGYPIRRSYWLPFCNSTWTINNVNQLITENGSYNGPHTARFSIHTWISVIREPGHLQLPFEYTACDKRWLFGGWITICCLKMPSLQNVEHESLKTLRKANVRTASSSLESSKLFGGTWTSQAFYETNSSQPVTVHTSSVTIIPEPDAYLSNVSPFHSLPPPASLFFWSYAF